MRVLIIEDSESLARLLSLYLKPVASRIVIAKTMAEAMIEIAKVDPIDLVTLDLNLPDSNVEATLERVHDIKVNHPECMLVIITGVATAEGQSFIVEGVDGIIRKQDMGQQNKFLVTLRDIFRSIVRVPVNYQRHLGLLEGLTNRLLSDNTDPALTSAPSNPTQL